MSCGSDPSRRRRLAWLLPGAVVLASLGTCSSPSPEQPAPAAELTLINLTGFRWQIEATGAHLPSWRIDLPGSGRETLLVPAGAYEIRQVAHAPDGRLERSVHVAFIPGTPYTWPLATLHHGQLPPADGATP